MEEAATGLIVQIECGGGRGSVQNIEMCKTQKCAKHRNVHSAKKHISSLVIPGFSDTSPETGLRRKTAGPQRTRGYDKQKNFEQKPVGNDRV